MEDPIRPRRRDQLLDSARIGELAVEECDAALVGLVGLPRAGRVATLDDIEDGHRHERVEVLHPRAPPVRAEDGDVGVLGEDVLSEVAAREPGDTGDENAHWAPRLARAMPLVGCLASTPEDGRESYPLVERRALLLNLACNGRVTAQPLRPFRAARAETGAPDTR